MSLRDEVQVVPYRKREFVGRLLEAQGESVEEFEELIADPTIMPQSIHDMLRRRGIAISHGTIHKWCRDARESA